MAKIGVANKMLMFLDEETVMEATFTIPITFILEGNII